MTDSFTTRMDLITEMSLLMVQRAYELGVEVGKGYQQPIIDRLNAELAKSKELGPK